MMRFIYDPDLSPESGAHGSIPGPLPIMSGQLNGVLLPETPVVVCTPQLERYMAPEKYLE